MNAVILAAGSGDRLRGVIGNRPKCLLRVGDSTLIERQMRTLLAVGIDRIVVVAGFRSADVRRVCDRSVDIVLNKRYATTNSLYSLSLARDLLADGFVVLNGDVLFHPQLLSDLIAARYEDALLVCARGHARPYSSEEMKVTIRRGLVSAMAKTLSDEESDGENIGIAKFGSAGARALLDRMDEIVGSGAVREWLPRAFADFSRLRPLYVVESRGYPWIEIDFPEDYWRACSDVLPAIEGTSAFSSDGEVSERPTIRTGRSLHYV